jgi:DNA-binding transcriptional ArsR family regulator
MEGNQEGLVHRISREGFKLLEDKTRRRIVFILRDEPHTVKDIADQLGMTPQNIYHHMNKLQDAGIVGLDYERRSGHLIESFYSVPSDTLVFSEDHIIENTTQQALGILNGLKELGVNIDITMGNATVIEELYDKYRSTLDNPLNSYEFCRECSASGFFMKFGPMNPLLLNRVLWFANLVKMDDEDFDESIIKYRELRKTLRELATR